MILPVLYFSVRLIQLNGSRHAILETVGANGLSGVPWASRSVSLENKISLFFEGLSKFEAQLSVESVMGAFYFINATAALLRLISQTSAHPRTAILVNTLINGFDDLWHFVILFDILNGGFIALAMAQFAGERDEFADIPSCFETLWEMLLGSMVESGKFNFFLLHAKRVHVCLGCMSFS